MKYLFWGFTLFMSSQAVADRVGNGGDALVCGPSVQFLDEYEATLNHLILDWGPISSDPYAMVEFVLNRIATKMSWRNLIYKEWLNEFRSQSQFIPGIQLGDIDDAGIVIIPAGCRIEQAVVQAAEDDLDVVKYRYTINQDLWEQMSPSSKAMLILHELVYRESLQVLNNSSQRVRYMSQHLASQQFSQLDSSQLFHLQKTFRGLYLENEHYSIESSAVVLHSELRMSTNSEEELWFTRSTFSNELFSRNYKIRLRTKSCEDLYFEARLENNFDHPQNLIKRNRFTGLVTRSNFKINYGVLLNQPRCLNYDDGFEKISGNLKIVRANMNNLSIFNFGVSKGSPAESGLFKYGLNESNVFESSGTFEYHLMPSQFPEYPKYMPDEVYEHGLKVHSSSVVRFGEVSNNLLSNLRQGVWTSGLFVSAPEGSFDVEIGPENYQNIKAFIKNTQSNILHHVEPVVFNVHNQIIHCKESLTYQDHVTSYQQAAQCTESEIKIPTTMGLVSLDLQTPLEGSHGRLSLRVYPDLVCGLLKNETDLQTIEGIIVKVPRKTVCINQNGFYYPNYKFEM